MAVAAWCSSCAIVDHHSGIDVVSLMKMADIFSVGLLIVIPLLGVESILRALYASLFLIPKEFMMAISSSCSYSVS